MEITETSLMRNLEEATRFVALLRDLGCEVALDDFGAGFSSFRGLRELGVDIVKIDGGFVENLTVNRDDQVFVRTLIDLARNLGIKTVAERVQDEEAAAIARRVGRRLPAGQSHRRGDAGSPAVGERRLAGVSGLSRQTVQPLLHLIELVAERLEVAIVLLGCGRARWRRPAAPRRRCRRAETCASPARTSRCCGGPAR